MQLNSHLTFNGQCEAAFQFYEKCLGGKITFMTTYGDTPMADKVSPELRPKVIHATLSLAGHQLTGADAPPERYQKPQGFSLTLNIETAAEADRIFAALQENGQVQMPIQETFWALRFGMLVDQFGTPWMINCGRPS
jgi:PhnB protein